MPELPEVEVTRLGFANLIAGARIEAVRMGKPLRWPLGAQPQALINRTVLGVRRRGKYLLLDLSEGMLLVHLGMSGSLRFAKELPAYGAHDHFELQTTQGLLRLTDPRRFGAVLLVEGEDDPRAQKLLAKLGLEPLEDAFTADVFYQKLQQRQADIARAHGVAAHGAAPASTEAPSRAWKTRSIEAGWRTNALTGRIGRRTNSPLQLGHTPCRCCATHSVQNVHSNEQMRASGESGGKSRLQRSQLGRS